jgi:hypothetical protein
MLSERAQKEGATSSSCLITYLIIFFIVARDLNS